MSTQFEHQCKRLNKDVGVERLGWPSRKEGLKSYFAIGSTFVKAFWMESCNSFFCNRFVPVKLYINQFL